MGVGQADAGAGSTLEADPHTRPHHAAIKIASRLEGEIPLHRTRPGRNQGKNDSETPSVPYFSHRPRVCNHRLLDTSIFLGLVM